MNQDFKDYLIKTTAASSCKEIELIQSLWSGYGKISRYQLDNLATKTIVVKYISLKSAKAHPRGWDTDFGHLRKVKSYEVETYWYEEWSQFCTDNCRIPHFLGSFTHGGDQWIILEDLNPDFPLRNYKLDIDEVKVCLAWLANFHAMFLHKKPTGLWEVGTYWHLNTRPDEYNKIEHQALKSKAYAIDDLLNQCKYQTIVHGDAKLANFCFSEDGDKVAAVDFQYVGGGCGIKDVAYFLGSCLTSDECIHFQDKLLDYYFAELDIAIHSTTIDIDIMALEQEWRSLYPVACTDFTRFLLGWMPTHQKVNDYHLRMMNKVLTDLIE